MTRRKPQPSNTVSRRSFVAGTLGGAAASALGGCGSDDDASGSSGASGQGAQGGTGAQGGSGGGAGASGSGGSGAGASGAGGSGGSAGASGDAGTCTLYPAQTEGPFYVDDDLVRSDITEGKPGAPLALTIVVLNASDCTPLAGAAVDIWQCDADGVYSGFPGQLGGLDTTGQTFLRGTQITDETGSVTFQTIYPGWYPGRTTHIHFKVRPTPTSEATSQLYFPEDVTSQVYAVEPYAARGQKDTANLADGVVAGNLPPLLAVAPSGAGYAGTLTVSIAG